MKNEIVKKPSKFTHPIQRPYTFYPGITAQPWYDTSKFSWVPMLESKQEGKFPFPLLENEKKKKKKTHYFSINFKQFK